ncbi:MAG: hypothetical protein LBQ75_02230 [Zoogloeaceae bacterium]|jgi:hypothetical protein|nr:hypothetical protein [Zoogloeaceae bacterium]
MTTVKGFPITPRIIGRIATWHMGSSLTGKHLPVNGQEPVPNGKRTEI